MPGTVHHRLDRAADFGAASASRPLFIGFGRDTAAMGYRHKGRGVFQTKGWDWDQQCQTPFTCNDVPNPALLCGLTGARGQYQLTDVRIDRTSTVVAYDGPLPGKGDSGGPLLLIGGYDVGNVLDLPAGQPFVLGALSVGNQSGTGVLIPPGSSQSGYAPTYANGNGAWIEQSLRALRTTVTAPTCTASADCGSSRVNVGCTSLAAPLVFERDAGSGFSAFASLTADDAARPLSVNDNTGGSGTVRYRVCNTKSATRLCSSVMSVSIPGAACPPPMKCPKGTFACGVPGDYTCVPSGHYCM